MHRTFVHGFWLNLTLWLGHDRFANSVFALSEFSETQCTFSQFMDLLRQRRIAAFTKRFQEFKQSEQLNTAAVDSKWRDILSTAKVAQQREDVAKIRARYTKQLDRCDAVISRLQQWLTEGESQYQFSLRSHKQNVAVFVALARSRLENEQRQWDTSVQAVVDEYESNRRRTLAEYNRHVAEVRDIMNAIEYEYDQRNKEMAAKTRAEEDSLKMKNQELISSLKMHLMSETNDVIEASKKAFDNFKQATEGKMQQFNAMFEKHKKRQKEMKLNEETIIRKAAEIAHWRRKIRSNERESKEANDRLRQEKENLSLHFRELKEIMAKFRRTEAAKLAEISVAFEDIHNDLTKKLSLAEKILKYAEMTRELETEKEQVLPFPPSVTETDPEIQRQMRQFKLQLKGDSKFVEESDLFDKFYRRFNKVLLDKMSLQREKAALAEHNHRLKLMVKRYMGGTGITTDLMERPNTLFIVNQETNAPKRKFESDDPIPVIEAALTLEANKLQGY